jgi:hypothetical protein
MLESMNPFCRRVIGKSNNCTVKEAVESLGSRVDLTFLFADEKLSSLVGSKADVESLVVEFVRFLVLKKVRSETLIQRVEFPMPANKNSFQANFLKK